MKLRRFVASDMRAALALIKAELGADAVIMSNKRVDEGIEIVAGYEDGTESLPSSTAASASTSAARTPKASASRTKSPKATSLSGYINDELDDDEVSIGTGSAGTGRASASHTSSRSSSRSSAAASSAASSSGRSAGVGSAGAGRGELKNSRTAANSAASTASDSVSASASAATSSVSPQDKAESFAKSLMEILERQQRSGALPTSRSAVSSAAVSKTSSSSGSSGRKSSRRQAPAPLSQQSGTGDFIRSTEEAQRKAAQKAAAASSKDKDNAKMEREHGISSYDEGISSKNNSASSAELERMRDEIAGLRKLLQFELAGLMRDSDARSQPVRAMLTSVLSSAGLEPRLAAALCDEIDADASVNFAWRELAKLLSARLKTGSDEILREGGVVALVGPAGVGKTTSLAKLAARFVIAYGADKIALVTCDHYRIGATEQLKTYARIMGCESYAVKSPAELPKLLLSLKDKSLVLVDTAGVGLRDSRFETQLSELKSQKRLSIKHYLVLPATARRRVLEEAYAHFESLKVKGLILTRLDESSSLMDALSLCLTRSLTLSYTSDGQKVPEDLEVPSAARVVQQALMSLENETAASAVS